MQSLGNKFLLFIFVFHFHYAYSNIVTRNFNSSNGLVNNSVRCFYEDDNGELWIGTEGGISIYDGYSFTTISTNDGLIGNSVWAIIGDPFGGKWVASYGKGLTYIKEGNISRYDKSQGLSNTRIRTIHYQNKKLFIGTDNGLFEFNYDNQTITEITYLQDESQSFQVMQFFKQGEDLLVATRKTGVFKVKVHNSKSTSIIKLGQGETLFKIIPYSNKFLYCTGKGVFSHAKLLGNYDNKIHNNVIWDFTYSSNSNDLYLASWNVLEEGGALLKLEEDSLINCNNHFNIDSKMIWATKFLKSKQLVVGSLDKGFYIIDNQIVDVKTIRIKNVKGRFQVRDKSFYYTDKQIFTKNGVSVFSLNKDNLLKWINQKYLVHTSLGDLAPDIKDFRGKKHQINNVNYFDSGIYVSTSIGLFKFSSAFNLEDIFLLQLSEFCILGSDLIYQRPYNEFNIINKLLSKDRLRQKLKIDESIPSDILKYQHLGDSLLIWTKNKGVFVYKHGEKPHKLNLNRDFEDIKSIDVWNNKVVIAISNNEIYRGLVTKTGVELHRIKTPISLKSIFKVSLNQSHFMIHFDNGVYLSDGIKERVLNQNNLLYKTTDYNCFLSANDIEIVSDNSVIQIPIEMIFSYQTFIPKVRFKHTNSDLPHNQSSVILEISRKATHHPNDYEYFYQLNGLDTIPISGEKIYLMNLTSGKYNVEILTFSTFQNKWFSSVSLSFDKLKAPWEKFYFWLLGASILSGVFILIYYRRRESFNKRTIEQQRVEQKLIRHRLEAVQAKMNPHFMFNSLNSIQNYIIDADTDRALLYLSEFSKLMRETVDYSSLNTIRLTEEIEFLERYIRIEQMRFTSKIVLEKNISGSIHSIKIPPMILQPLIENAFIHGLKNNSQSTQVIRLDVNEVSDSETRIIISNSKSDLKQTFKNHKSFGLDSIEERLKLMNPKNSLKIIESDTNFTVEIQLSINEKTLNFND